MLSRYLFGDQADGFRLDLELLQIDELDAQLEAEDCGEGLGADGILLNQDLAKLLASSFGSLKGSI